MSADQNDSNRKLNDSSVSLKKKGIASTQDVLDVISYLEKEKKLHSYEAMIQYLSTAGIKSLDDPLKEIGLTSRKAVKEVIKGIEGLKEVNIDFSQLNINLSQLNANLARSNLYSAYVSNLNNLVAPLTNPVAQAVQQMQETLQPLSARWWQQIIQQIVPDNFDPFLYQSALVEELDAARNLDIPVSQLVRTLKATENELAETTRDASNAYKPKPAEIDVRDQSFLKNLYALSIQKTGQPDTSVYFRCFDPTDVNKRDIALYLADVGLVKVKGDCSVSITQKGVEFVEMIESEKTPRKKQLIPPESEKPVKPIFLAHGHDKPMKKAVIRVLNGWKIAYKSLDEEPDVTRPNIRKFLGICDELKCGVVLLSADDQCHKKSKGKKGTQAGERDTVSKSRARQNVIWELWYCYGHYGEANTIIIYREDDEFEWPSNLGSGIGYVPFHNGDWRQKFKRELEARKYAVKNDKFS
jgi:predicted nucleotide-binding protein